MREIEKGLFLIGGDMPCLPAQIKIYYWGIPNTLGSVECEEAAARILSFSKRLDLWVGVSWDRLEKMIKNDYELYLKQDRNRLKKEIFEKELSKYKFKVISSLGIYNIFNKVPTIELEELNRKVPFSGVFTSGTDFVIAGIQRLIEGDFIKRVKVGEGKNTTNVFFPSPLLIQKILVKQGNKI